MKIKQDQYYKPRDVAKYKLIVSSRGDCSYNFVLDEIKAGRLVGENRGRGKTPYFWIKGSELLRYRKENNLFIGENNETELVATPGVPY